MTSLHTQQLFKSKFYEISRSRARQTIKIRGNSRTVLSNPSNIAGEYVNKPLSHPGYSLQRCSCVFRSIDASKTGFSVLKLSVVYGGGGDGLLFDSEEYLTLLNVLNDKRRLASSFCSKLKSQTLADFATVVRLYLFVFLPNRCRWIRIGSTPISITTDTKF